MIQIKSRSHWLWRAVDANGDMLDILVQSRRSKAAALRFLRKLMKRWGLLRGLVTDKLRSYGATKAEITHRQHKGLNNRRVSMAPLPPQKKTGNLKFLSLAIPVVSLFRPKRHRLSAKSYRHTRSDAFSLRAGYAAELIV